MLTGIDYIPNYIFILRSNLNILVGLVARCLEIHIWFLLHIRQQSLNILKLSIFLINSLPQLVRFLCFALKLSNPLFQLLLFFFIFDPQLIYFALKPQKALF